MSQHELALIQSGSAYLIYHLMREHNMPQSNTTLMLRHELALTQSGSACLIYDSMRGHNMPQSNTTHYVTTKTFTHLKWQCIPYLSYMMLAFS